MGKQPHTCCASSRGGGASGGDVRPVLRIKTIRGGGAEAARYYSPENDRRPDEYYGREVEVRAVWWSPGETFGLQSGADVRPDEVRNAMEGCDPSGSGKALTQAQKGTRRAAYDLNMSLPKSVSVLFAAADRDTRAGLLAETRAAAVEVLAEMQRQGVFTVRSGKGGATQEGARDVLALVDVHQSARDGAPFLHVHAVVMNFGRRGDGTTGSLNDREMHRAAGEAGALFRAGVAAALERRGFGVERVPGEEGRRAASFRVAGIGPGLENAFSGRKERMVEYVVAKYGAVSNNAKVRASQMQEAAQNTRGSKARVPTGTALEAHWRATIAGQGTTPERVLERAREAARGVERPTLSAAETVALQVQRSGGEAPDAATLRRRVAVEAQFTGEGAAGALREMDRLVRNGVQQVAREAERTLEHTRGGGQDRSAEAAGAVARVVAGLARDLGGIGGAGGGVTGDPAPATPKRRRRERGQERER